MKILVAVYSGNWIQKLQRSHWISQMAMECDNNGLPANRICLKKKCKNYHYWMFCNLLTFFIFLLLFLIFCKDFFLVLFRTNERSVKWKGFGLTKNSKKTQSFHKGPTLNIIFDYNKRKFMFKNQNETEYFILHCNTNYYSFVFRINAI